MQSVDNLEETIRKVVETMEAHKGEIKVNEKSTEDKKVCKIMLLPLKKYEGE